MLNRPKYWKKKLVSVQILLGPVDADADDGEPDRPSSGNHLLQRREHSLVDHLQRGLGHTFHGRLGSQLQDGHHQGRQHWNNTGAQVWETSRTFNSVPPPPRSLFASYQMSLLSLSNAGRSVRTTWRAGSSWTLCRPSRSTTSSWWWTVWTQRSTGQPGRCVSSASPKSWACCDCFACPDSSATFTSGRRSVGKYIFKNTLYVEGVTLSNNFSTWKRQYKWYFAP